MRTLILFCLLVPFFLNAVVKAQDVRPPDVPMPKAINSVVPDYGDFVRQYGTSGMVTVSANIDKAGKVTPQWAFGPAAYCTDLKSPAIEAIRKAALDAAAKSVFESPMKDGKPTEINVHLTYKFGSEPVMPVTDPKKPRLINGGVLNGRAKKLPKPNYPAAAGANRVGGLVEVNVLISETGEVVTAFSLRGHPLLRESAVEAACQAKFDPFILQGNPVKVQGSLTYNFHP